jgi:hypothetical protein
LRLRAADASTVSRIAGLAVAAGLLGWTFLGLDPSRAARAAATVGPLLLLALLPYVAGACLDCVGLHLVLARLARPVRYLDLLEIRLCADALLLSAPGGALVSEGLTPHLLHARCGVPLPEGVASVAARKCLAIAAQSLYLFLAAAIATPSLASAPLPAGGLPLGLTAMSALLMTASVAGAGLLGAGGTARRLHGWLVRVPWRRLRCWLGDRADRFRRTDHHLAAILGPETPRLDRPLLSFLFASLIESLESFLVLSLLGTGLAYTQVLPMEAGVSLLRSLAFFVPAGLGVQEAAHVALLASMGVPDPVLAGAVLAAAKRFRETGFVAAGYVLLARRGRAVPA